MCGIAGQFLHLCESPSLATLTTMATVMECRGPDDEGISYEDHIGLAHCRLSIRDLTAAGHCPMATEDNKLQIVFNGEIYNWREIKQELENKGITFASQSDTEVVLYSYRVWGLDFASKLRGMFAIAIWDSEKKRLLLARDRAGEKPLFFKESPEGLVFASTTEALKPLLDQREIDPVAMACHLSHCFIPASHTIWKNLKVLPPAHILVIEPNKAAEIQRYWDFPRSGPIKRSLPECEQVVEKALEDSVIRCLDADVPVGVFLSGGVDSSLVAALAARQSPGIQAFSLGFDEATHSELPYACQVAEYIGLEHHTVKITVDDVIESLPHLVQQYGQPFGDSSSVPTYQVAKLARKHVKVCLSGDGGDEAFGGYWRMQSGVYAARYGAFIPAFIRKTMVPAIAGRLGAVGQRWLAMNSLSLGLPGASYNNSLSWFEHLSEISGPSLIPTLNMDLSSLRVGRAADRLEASVVQRMLYDDFQVQLPDAYLTKVDVASMAASLEVRSPFLDHSLLELAWSLPDNAKLNWARRKWLLKKIATRFVPAEIVHRPKMGFAMPVSQWFRNGLGDMLDDLLAESASADEGWINTDTVKKYLQDHRNGCDHSTRLWLILWLELWFRLVGYGKQSEVS